ncbi:hypothetical protein HBH64_211820 [Parastagonospora nodorum]|nr:hypothetical protein HBH42_159860 [Parastagonospora nodorum]KAH4219912.1 hypothetical protein HBI06_176490 [Parastagonospora nodorum]KAH4231339.1 hypothetical protein HBI05_177860 [Parastagonospora nodorum]KAH4360342.1 hypothetical protein HBH94_193520 [Parastagonospora nodorum]KAH4423521.1 hypothetical protein HBH93_192590 [Parastagonospora nodorum]
MAPKSMMSHTNPATPTAHATPFVAVRTTKAPATRMSQTTYAMPMVFAKISRLLMAQTVASSKYQHNEHERESISENNVVDWEFFCSHCKPIPIRKSGCGCGSTQP